MSCAPRSFLEMQNEIAAFLLTGEVDLLNFGGGFCKIWDQEHFSVVAFLFKDSLGAKVRFADNVSGAPGGKRQTHHAACISQSSVRNVLHWPHLLKEFGDQIQATLKHFA